MNHQQKKLRVVLAEDDTDDGEIMVSSFERNGAFDRVDWVRNGIELLHFLKENAESLDVILTDINMPLMTGIEVLEEICDDSALKAIPAFVYSSTLNPVYETKCMKLGIKGFLIKPLRINEFDDIPKRIVSVLEQS